VNEALNGKILCRVDLELPVYFLAPADADADALRRLAIECGSEAIRDHGTDTMIESVVRCTAGEGIMGVWEPDYLVYGVVGDDVTLADTLLSTPLNPAFHSLNLSQAVLLMAYEWYQLTDRTPAAQLLDRCDRLATKGELVNFFERLEVALDKSGFFHVREKRPIMVRNIRNMFQRAGLMEQEVRTLHGIVSRLSDPHAFEPEK